MKKSNPAKGFVRLALAATVAATGVLAVCTPAHAADTWQRISVYNSGLVAYVPSPFTDNDLQVETAVYDPMHYSGQWLVTEVAANTVTFENRWSHQCLDTLGGLTAEVGTPVVQNTCDETMSQKWVRVRDDTLKVWHITNFLSGKSLGVEAGSDQPGAGFMIKENSDTNTSRMFQIW